MPASSTITRSRWPSFEGAVLQAVQGFGDGVAGVAGAFAHRDIDGLTGRRQDQNLPVAAARHGGQGAHGGGLARPRRRAQRLHQPG